MGDLVLKGATSGQITLTPTAIAGTNTLTVPAATDTIVCKNTTDTLTNKTLTSPTITGASMSSMASSVITSGTSQATTSGTSIDFTGIPSWAKRVTVMFNGVSTNGSSNIQIQLGTSGGFDTSGYSSGGTFYNGSTGAGSNSSTGLLVNPSVAASDVVSGIAIISLVGSNVWVQSATLGRTNAVAAISCGGNKTLSGVLDRVRITTVAGTDTFDAGSINILYE